MAVANYHEEYGHYPPAFVLGPDGRPWHSWRVLILPLIEHNELFKEYDFSEPWDGPKNRRLAERMPMLFAFHGDYRPGNTTANYLAVVGAETVWPGATTATSKLVTDGLGVTILVVENQVGVPWMAPRDLSLADMDFEFNGLRGVSSKYRDPAVVMLDGSLHRLAADISPDTLRALLTIKGGEPVRSNEAGGWELLPDGRQRTVRQP